MRRALWLCLALGCAASARRGVGVSGGASREGVRATEDVASDAATPSCAASAGERACFAAGLSGLGRAADEGHFEERPPHAARLSAFELDRTEVTVARWSECVTAGRCPDPTCAQEAADAPVRCVPWSAAQAYCAFRGGRLPTEAEWERAAAGALPEHRRFPWGETAEGATADRTPEGVLALGGGVAEWVQDRGVFYPALPREPRDAGLDGGDAASEPDATSFSDEPEVATDAAATDAPERLESGLYVLNDPRGDDARSVWRVVRGGDGRVPIEARTTTMRRFRAPTDALPWVGLRCAYAH